jgi:hypothetical protein
MAMVLPPTNAPEHTQKTENRDILATLHPRREIDKATVFFTPQDICHFAFSGGYVSDCNKLEEKFSIAPFLFSLNKVLVGRVSVCR